MTHEVDATYEQGGLLRLAHPLPLANQQNVQVIVSDGQSSKGKWAAVNPETGTILACADSVKQARDSGRALGCGEPLVQWISGEPEFPSAGL